MVTLGCYSSVISSSVIREIMCDHFSLNKTTSIVCITAIHFCYWLCVYICARIYMCEVKAVSCLSIIQSMRFVYTWLINEKLQRSFRGNFFPSNTMWVEALALSKIHLSQIFACSIIITLKICFANFYYLHMLSSRENHDNRRVRNSRYTH